MADATPDSADLTPPAAAALPAPAELIAAAIELPSPQQFPTVSSADGRVVLTNDSVQINGQSFGWWELESADMQRVRWLLWLLLGGFTLTGFLLGFPQNWLRTMPAALGMTIGALLLAFGQRGTNRLRLHRLGREATHFALPGELGPWQKLTAEINRRIRQRQQETAMAATAALALAATSPPDSSFAAE